MSRAWFVGIIAVVVIGLGAAGWLVRHGDARQSPEFLGGSQGPLVRAEVIPRLLEGVTWFLYDGVLWAPDDDPVASRELLHALASDVAYLQKGPPMPDAAIAPLAAWPFAIGLRGGSVLLADRLRLELSSDTAVHGRLHGRFHRDAQRGFPSTGLVVASPRLRLKVPSSWQVVQAVDPGTHQWREVRAEHSGPDVSRLQRWLDHLPVVFLIPDFDRLSGLRLVTWYANPANAHADRESAKKGGGYLIRFASPVRVQVASVPSSEWDPYYYQKDRSAVQSPIVAVTERSVQEALLVPEPFDNTCRVYLRAAGSPEWVCGVSLPSSL